MNLIFLLLLTTVFGTIQALLGGTRLSFSFPAYAILSVGAVLSIVSFRKHVSKASAPCLWVTLALAVYVLVRNHFSPFEFLARPDFYMTLGCLAIYLLSSLYFTSSRYRLALFGVLLLFSLVQVAAGAMQFIHGDGFMLFGFLREDNSSRASGLFISGNHFAGLLESLAIFGLSIAFWSRLPVVLRMLFAYCALTCYAGVAMSGSRGGYISSVFSLLVFAVLSIAIFAIVRPKKAGRLTVMIIGGAVLALGSAGFLMLKSDLIRERLSMISTATRDVRVYNWQAALDQFKVNPVTGTGSGTHLLYGRLFRRPIIQTDPVHAHCDYLEMLAEYGIAGEALAVLFLAVHLSHGFRETFQIATKRLRGGYGPARSDALALNLGAIGTAAALISHSVVDFNMHIPGNALFYALVFGALANPGADRNPPAPKWFSTTTLCRAILPPLGFATLFLIAPLIKPELLTEQARVALRDNKLQGCAALARQAAAADPKNPFPHYYLGETNRFIGLGAGSNFALRRSFFGSAIESYQAGLQIFPYDETMLVRMGQCLDLTLQLKAADTAYEKAIRWDPNLGVLYGYYATHLRLAGRSSVRMAYQNRAGYLGSPDPMKTGMAEVRSMLEPSSERPEPASTNRPRTATPKLRQ